MQRNIRRLPPRDRVQRTRVSNKKHRRQSPQERVKSPPGDTDLLTGPLRQVDPAQGGCHLPIVEWRPGFKTWCKPDSDSSRSTSAAANEHQCTAGYFNGFRITISVLTGCGWSHWWKNYLVNVLYPPMRHKHAESHDIQSIQTTMTNINSLNIRWFVFDILTTSKRYTK